MEYKNTYNNINNKSNSRPIGFFDSGVGGLTVFSKVKKLFDNICNNDKLTSYYLYSKYFKSISK